MEFASQAKLNDSAATIAYRAKYSFAAARKAPSIVACDVATSDNYYSGSILSTAFGNFTKLLTNGTGVYVSFSFLKLLEGALRNVEGVLSVYLKPYQLRNVPSSGLAYTESG